MTYLLAMIAGIWMADGLSLLFAPSYVMKHIRDALSLHPQLIKWEGLSIVLGIMLTLNAPTLIWETLWHLTGIAMIGKGLFFVYHSNPLQVGIVQWCLAREDIDYRFWGLGLCTLAILLLHAGGML